MGISNIQFRRGDVRLSLADTLFGCFVSVHLA